MIENKFYWETLIYIVLFLELLLFLKKLKTYNDNPAATFTCSRMAYFYLKSPKDWHLYKIKKMLFCKKTKIEFRDSKLQTHFFKDYCFF